MTNLAPVIALTHRSAASSPYAVLSAGHDTAPQRKSALLAMSRILESRALRAGAGALVIATLQEAHQLSRATLAAYRELAAAGVDVVLLAHGLTAERDGHFCAAPLDAQDSVRDEWDVLVCTPRLRYGFAAKDVHRRNVEEMGREFRWISSRDATAVARAAETLLNRVPSVGLGVPALA